MKTEHDFEQRSPEWFAARRGRITASNVAAILGRDPFRNADDVMRQMVRDHHGAPSEFTGNVATHYGQMHEREALEALEDLMVVDIEEVAFWTREGDEWAGCSPDGVIESNGHGLVGVEIKCPYSLRNVKDRVDEPEMSVPPGHYDQMQFSMWVTGRGGWYYGRWCPAGIRPRFVSVDHDWQSENLPILREFHARFLEECEAPDRHLDPLREELGAGAGELVADYLDLKQTIAAAQERQKQIIAELVEMSDGCDAKIGDVNLTYVKRGGAVSYGEAIKDLLPDADLEPYRGKPSGYWRLG